MVELKFSRQESKAHRLLKMQAVEFLKSLGFKDDEILMEKSTDYGRVDVAGVRPDLKVAVECGCICSYTHGSESFLGVGRGKKLLKYFDRVYYFLYLCNAVRYLKEKIIYNEFENGKWPE